ncbi:MAG: hypothetical protein WDO69_15275 [Pseudomonadota bacterium]
MNSEWLTSPRTRRLLAALCLFTGLTAIGGGLELMWNPDGSIIRLPLSLLEHSPFRDFFIPGLLLAGLVGVINTIAGVLILCRHPRGDAEAMVSGSVLVAWIGIEVLFLRHVHWLHAAYLVIGLATAGLAAARENCIGQLANTIRTLTRVAVHVTIGWALCGATMGLLLAATCPPTALAGHALAAPVIFAAVSASYFRGPYAWPPFRAATIFASVPALLDLVIVAGFVQRSLSMFQSFIGSWLPLALIFLATWVTGTLRTNGHAGHVPQPRS